MTTSENTTPATASAHTPGPWRVWNNGKGYYLSICASAHRNLATVMQRDNRPESFDERTANARLIAAAPDLLEALKTIDQWSQDSGKDFPYWVVEEAISKATGSHQ